MQRKKRNFTLRTSRPFALKKGKSFTDSISDRSMVNATMGNEINGETSEPVPALVMFSGDCPQS
jgi:hypothetical protein